MVWVPGRIPKAGLLQALGLEVLWLTLTPLTSQSKFHSLGPRPGNDQIINPKLGSFPLTVTVTTMGYRSYKNPLNKAPLRTVTGRGNDPTLNPKPICVKHRYSLLLGQVY